MPDFSFTEDDMNDGQLDEVEAENHDAPPSYLAEDIDIEGSLGVKYGLEVAGRFKGDLYSNSKINVLATGYVEGQAEAFDISIEGSAVGDFIPRKCFEIKKEGHFVGNLQVQPEVIRLSEFAVFGETKEIAEEFSKEFNRDRSKRILENANREASQVNEELGKEESVPGGEPVKESSPEEGASEE
jgi:cytoskeletal protein CcmA (bactofilin family)